MKDATPVFEARGLGRTYGQGSAAVRALDGVSFDVAPGEHVVVSGPSGSGKTSLLNALGLLDAGFTGALRYRGLAVSGLSHAARARLRLAEIGFVYQGFHLLAALDVLDNVALPHWHLHGNRRRARRRADALLAQLGLEGHRRHRIAELSVGETQRVAVARALVNEPRVVLADEPSASLDAASTRALLDLLRSVHAAGCTLVVITHDPQVAAVAPRQIELRYGRVVPRERP